MCSSPNCLTLIIFKANWVSFFLLRLRQEGSEATHLAVCAKFRPLARHGTPWRYSKTAHRCDTRRHGRSGDHKRERRRVFSYQKVISPSSTSSSRNFQVSAVLDLV